MPKIKLPKSSPLLDMTPMVDLAFLLVTFFMLTASVRVDEPVIVDTPSSVSEKILPPNTVMVIIDKDGRSFYNMDNPKVRISTLERMGKQYNITFSDAEKSGFARMGSFGVPIQSLKQYIMMDAATRAKYKSPGIPVDSLNNQLGDWIVFGYSEAGKSYNAEKNKAKELGRDFKAEKPRLALKADGKTNYIAVQNVINIIKKKKLEPRLNFITNLEQEE